MSIYTNSEKRKRKFNLFGTPTLHWSLVCVSLYVYVIALLGLSSVVFHFHSPNLSQILKIHCFCPSTISSHPHPVYFLCSRHQPHSFAASSVFSYKASHWFMIPTKHIFVFPVQFDHKSCCRLDIEGVSRRIWRSVKLVFILLRLRPTLNQVFRRIFPSRFNRFERSR